MGRFRPSSPRGTTGAGTPPPAGSGKHTHLNGGQGLANSDETPAPYEPGWVASDDVNIAPTSANLACGAPYTTWTNSAGSQRDPAHELRELVEAYAFCIWDGGFLPSEAEFGYAHGGRKPAARVPLGDGGAVEREPVRDLRLLLPEQLRHLQRGGEHRAVGTATLGAGAWGQLDLTGNVFRWTLDSYATSSTRARTARTFCRPLHPPRSGAATTTATWRTASTPGVALPTLRRRPAEASSGSGAPGPREGLLRVLVGTIGAWIIYGLIWLFGRKHERADVGWLARSPRRTDHRRIARTRRPPSPRA